MAFLDNEGLAYYNSKLQTKLDSKQNTTFSDGAPVIPVKEISAEDYAALSENDKKLPIVYLVKGAIANSVETSTNSVMSYSSGSAFDLSYEPINDEGIMTLESDFAPVFTPMPINSSFEVSV